MTEFRFDGLEEPIVLPDEHLTVPQWENCMRYFRSAEVKEDSFDDPYLLRQLVCLLIGKGEEYLGNVVMTEHNRNELYRMYGCLGPLLQNAFSIGDEVVDEVEKKDTAATRQPKGKSTGRKK